MKAIISEYRPGITRAARYSATDGDGNRVSVQQRDDLNSDQNHAEAVRKLCRKMNWTGTLVKGWFKKTQWVWVWVERNHQETGKVIDVRDCLTITPEAIARDWEDLAKARTPFAQ